MTTAETSPLQSTARMGTGFVAKSLASGMLGAAIYLAGWAGLAATDLPGIDALAEEEAPEVAAPVAVVEAAEAIHDRLQDAIRANDVATVAAVLATHPKLDSFDRIGYTPLAAACKQYRVLRTASVEAQADNRRILTLLLAAGAPCSGTVVGREQPLLLYVRRSRPETWLFEQLLAHGANPNVEYRGLPLLYHLLYQPHLDFAALAIAHGADVNASLHGQVQIDYDRPSTMLQVAVLTNYGSISGDLSPSFELLLKHGANPNLTDEHGKTALHYAVRWDQDGKAVAALLQHGANPDLRDKEGYLPLTYATYAAAAEALAPVTTTASSEDLRQALAWEHNSAVIALHQSAMRVRSPLWLVSWLGVLLAAVWLTRRRVHALGPVAAASQSGGRSRRRSRRRQESATATDAIGFSREAVDPAQARLQTAVARYERLRWWALPPLAAYGAMWSVCFGDLYLQGLGLTVILGLLGGGVFLAGLAANLFVSWRRGRVLMSAVGVVCSLAAALMCLFWVWLYFHFGDISLTLLFLGTGLTMVGLAAVFGQSLNAHWMLKRKTRLDGVDLTPKKEADDLEVAAGWDAVR